MSRCDCCPRCSCRHTAAQECQIMETRHPRGQSAQRSGESLKVSRPRTVATGDWIPPQKPRRNQDALCEITRSAPLSARLRSPGCGDPNPRYDPKRLHSAWHTKYRGCRLNPSGVRGKSASERFVQQSPSNVHNRREKVVGQIPVAQCSNSSHWKTRTSFAPWPFDTLASSRERLIYCSIPRTCCWK